MHVSKSPNPFLDSKKRIPLRNREYSLGPQLNVTLTPPGLVVSMAKKIPQDVAFRLAQKAKEAEKKAKEAEKKAKDAEKKIKEAEKKVKEAEKLSLIHI